VYRPPPSRGNSLSVKQFLSEFADYLEHLVTCSGPLLILGDFNFHIKDASDKDALSFLRLVSSFDLQQHVQQSTHRGGHILDLVLTRATDNVVTSAYSEDHGFPDHFPVFMQLSVSKPQLPKQEVTYRKTKAIDPAVLSQSIADSALSSPSVSSLPLPELTELYDSELSSILDTLAPLKTRTITIRPESEWYNDTIREAKQSRRQAERRWRKSGLHVHRELYLQQRDEVNKLIAEAKQEHFRSAVAESKGDTKKLFTVVNRLLGKDSVTPLPAGKSISDISEMFSEYFVQKIAKIRNSITCDSSMPVIQPPFVSSSLTTFEPVTSDEVTKLITSSPNKSCDLDPIPTSLVKQEVSSLTSTITTIINESLGSGSFPQCFKSALVTPLLKKPTLDPDELKNYRPVSNLAFVSKLIEKVVASQLQTYLATNDLLEPRQSAYRQGHSTESALLRVQNDFICAMGEQKVILVVQLDLSAAFDTVDHHQLLKMLRELGIHGVALQWFESYLTSRTQTIRVKGEKSSSRELTCGVPQGSVLGPILFTIYTASLGALLRHVGVDYHLYADDSWLYIMCKASEIDSAITRMETTIALVHKWMKQHHLKMNEDKTEFLVISSKQLANKIPSPPSLSVGSHTITPSATAKGLGVTMDSQASMEAHISSVCKRAYIHLKNISQLRRYLDTESLECIVHAFITTMLDYCNSLLCGVPSVQLNRLQSIQNTAARIISGTAKYDHITPVMHALHWLPVQERVKFKTLVFVYKALNNMAPQYLQELLSRHSPPRQLRSSDQNLLTVPHTRSSLVQNRAFSVAGPRLWNELPCAIRSSPSLTVFKSKLKTHLFSQYYS
jgi:hypothetical protein